MSSTGLELVIQKLIASKREGEYWDFKARPHDNKADLLHDVLCLANSLHKGERYLIIGVEDPAKGSHIIGVGAADAGRKSQANYLDFLRDQKFAGSIRPEIKLITLTLEGKEVEVLVIADVAAKPYWLTEDYADRGRTVRQHVYTRVGDTNTPMNKSADAGQVEKMWRQRLGLDVLPVEKMQQLLRESADWETDFGNKRYAYHRGLPEYQVKLSRPKPFWEPYSCFFTNQKSFLGTARFLYNSTTLFELEYAYLDEMRLLLPAPEVAHVFLPDRELWYYYYHQSEAAGAFLTLLTAGRRPLESRGMPAPFLLFRDEPDQQAFSEYLAVHQDQLAAMPPGPGAQLAAQAMRKAANPHVVDLLDVGRIGKLYAEWQRSKLSSPGC